MAERRVKIVGTLGPATDSPAAVRRLIRAGLDVARLNRSHGTPAWHARMVRLVRAEAAAAGRTVAILADLQGPKIRTGPLPDGKPVELREGRELVLTTRRVPSAPDRVTVDDPRFPAKVRPGARLFLSDGLLELRVRAVRGPEVRTTVVRGGALKPRQGVNLPGARWNRPALTSKDHADLHHALRLGVDWIALSFVQSAADVRSVQATIRRSGARTPLIVKLEKPEAVADLDRILDAADGVMVARGDLGVEMGPERVPVVQKRIIARAHGRRLPVITATQMLESMTGSPRPTRAEASDVANAVLDGTDAVMLSAETASGKYPLEAVAMMDRIVRAAEAGFPGLRPAPATAAPDVPSSIAQAVRAAAADLRLAAIAAFTESGTTVRLVAADRPRAPIYGFTSSPATARRLGLLWGVRPRLMPAVKHVEDLSRHAERALRREGTLKPGDVMAVVAGTPLRRPGRTNFLKLVTVGQPH